MNDDTLQIIIKLDFAFGTCVGDKPDPAAIVAALEPA